MSNLAKNCTTCGRSFKSEEDFFDNTCRWRLCTMGHLWFNCDCGSTLMIKKGKFPWYSPEKTLSEEAASVFNKLSSIKELPHIPTVIMKLQMLLQNPEKEVSELAQIIRLDPLLSSQILTLANNLKSQRSEQIAKLKSIEHAIVYVGRKTLNDMIMAIPIKSIDIQTQHFDKEQFWKHSYYSAAISEKISTRYVKQLNPDEAYLAGFLANLGKVISGLYFPEKIDQAQQFVNDPRTMTTWSDAEDAVGVTNHSILGEIGAAMWGLPEFVMDAARHHHAPPQQKLNVDEVTIVDVVSFANILTHWLNFEPHRICQTTLETHMKNFKLSDKEVDKIVEELGYLKDCTQLAA